MNAAGRTSLALCLSTLCLAPAGCQTPDNDRPRESVRRFDARLDFGLDQLPDTWTFRTPGLWHIATEGDHHFLQMKPPPERPMLAGVRRPQESAIYNRYPFRSFSLSCWLRIDTDPSVAGRDACIIFGRVDETHFYYVHLSNESHGPHNTIMRVDGDSRTSLIENNDRLPPAITDTAWHKVDVLRDVNTGSITVYVDERKPPLFQATDRTYEWGYIGIGSFNDHASFHGLRIRGEVPDRS